MTTMHSIWSEQRLTRSERSDRTRELFDLLQVESSAERQADLRDQLVRLNLRVAQAVAARYRDRGVDEDDLQQAAAHGLLKAILRFDPALNKDFLTYAVPTIRGEVQRYFRDASWTIRPPRRLQELQWRVNASIDRLTGELGREPGTAEVIDDLDIGYHEFVQAVTSFGCFQPPSIDQPVAGSDDLVLADTLPEDSHDLDSVEARVVLGPLLATLTPHERHLLYLRFVEGRTQQQIGDEFGVAQMQVSRWLSRILARLRFASGEDTLLTG